MNILTSIKNLLASAQSITASQLGSDGQKIVSDAVNAAEAIGGSGSVKFSAAIAQAGSDLLALGKDVSLFVLHLAIEAAVTTLNAPAITSAVTASNDAASASASPAAAPTAQPAAAAPVVPQAAVAAPAPDLSGQALSNAVANVQAGSPIETEASTLVAELGGQGKAVTVDQAETAIRNALPTVDS